MDERSSTGAMMFPEEDTTGMKMESRKIEHCDGCRDPRYTGVKDK